MSNGRRADDGFNTCVSAGVSQALKIEQLPVAEGVFDGDTRLVGPCWLAGVIGSFPPL
jgi:hypothetical protein